MKGTERDKTLLDMVITTGSPSEAWKIILSMVGESSEAAQDKVMKEFEELTFEIGKESTTNYLTRAKALVMKLVNTVSAQLKKRLIAES